MVQEWMNDDGLYLRYGADKTIVNPTGEYVTTGPQRMVEVRNLDLTALTTTAVIVGNSTLLPKMRIEKVEVIARSAAATGTSAALNIGIIRTTRLTGTSGYDIDGLVEALAVTAMDAAGETTVLTAPVSGTSVGDVIGTTLANPYYIIASTSTGTFTQGTVDVRIYYTAIV